jgi:uncharacterized protein YqgQ
MNKEELVKILGNEELKSDEERVNAINKLLAESTIPKDKYNDTSAKLREAEEKLTSMTNEFEEFKKSKMTDEEKKNAEKESMQNQLLKYQLDLNRLEVEKIFESNGLTQEDYKDIEANIIGKDRETSIASANAFVSILKANSDKVAQRTKEELLKSTPTPVGGNGAGQSVSNLDELTKAYSNAVANKDTFAQAKLLREIQQEQAKNQSNI